MRDLKVNRRAATEFIDKNKLNNIFDVYDVYPREVAMAASGL